MIVIPEIGLKSLMTAIVGATHGLTDTGGRAHITSTINERQLRTAALVALEVAIGETIWPGDRTITIQRPKRQVGIFEEE